MKANGVETLVSSKKSINGAGVSTPSIGSGVGTSVPSNSIEKNGTKVPAPGYKQTKVGVIPEDWDVVKLNERTSIKRGKFSPRPRNDPQFFNGIYPFVQTNEVVNSKGRIKNYSKTLNAKGLKVSKLFPQGTILMTIAANIGFTGILEEDMACPDSLVGIQCKKGLNNEYLNFYFIYNQKRIDYLAEEAAQKNINLSTLNKIFIPLPPLKEQQKIAQILTTWDNAISKQEQLISAKETLKKGLMQKLLSGEVLFGEFGVGTSVPSKKNVNGAGVSTPSIGVETSVSSDNNNGTEVPTPSGWEEVQLRDISNFYKRKSSTQ